MTYSAPIYLEITTKQGDQIETNEVEVGFDSVVGRTSWAEPVGVGLEPGFPFRFQCQLDQGLERPIEHRGN